MTTPENPANPHGIQRTPIAYVVLAGNVSEYNQWKQRHEIPMGTALYASNPQVLMGMTFRVDDVRFVTVGTFYQRSDAEEILTAARLSVTDGTPAFYKGD